MSTTYHENADETAPLLEPGDQEALYGTTPDFHLQYCRLVGLIPSDVPPEFRSKYPKPGSNTLYARAKARHRSTQLAYAFSATLSTTLLLSQIVLGAALTALGAANSSHILIALFGALNTVIAGLVAYLKSRGQPMRSRMFKDDLERVVAEIQNSEILWLGVSKQMSGYSDIDLDEVSVRSEVARLTRLYDKAIKNNLMNNPEMYTGGQNADTTTALRHREGAGAVAETVAPAAAPAPVPSTGVALPGPEPIAQQVAPIAAADESPATMMKKSGEDIWKDTPKSKSKPKPTPEGESSASKDSTKRDGTGKTDAKPLPNGADDSSKGSPGEDKKAPESK